MNFDKLTNDQAFSVGYEQGHKDGWGDCLLLVSEYSCDGDCTGDMLAQAYKDGYNNAVAQITEDLKR